MVSAISVNLMGTLTFFVTAFLAAFLLLSIITAPGLCVKTSANVPKAQADTRLIHCPDKSIGSVMVVKAHKPDDTWAVYGFGEPQQKQGAKGTVSLTVPRGYSLYLDTNRRVFENPLLLEEVSPDGIDILKLSFTSMDDREDHMLEQALEHVNHLTGLRVLCLDRSEVTDKQISKLGKLPHLCCINFFLSSINGSCFKDLSAFPELYEIDVPFCQIDQSNIASLAGIRQLRNLDLRHSDTSLKGARALQKLTGLVRLNLGENLKVDDECANFLRPLVHLKQLDLRGTGITMAGVKPLGGLKLEYLWLPARLQTNLKELTMMFPNAKIYFEGSRYAPPTRDDKKIFAPLR
jgi:hypothetical protein